MPEDAENKRNRVNELWKDISDRERDELTAEMDKDMAVYEKELEVWRKKHNITEENEKRKKSKKKVDSDEETKVQKSKAPLAPNRYPNPDEKATKNDNLGFINSMKDPAF